MAAESLQLLCNPTKLERDRGILEFQRQLSTINENGMREYEAVIFGLLQNSCSLWESKHGALIGAKALLGHELCSDDFAQNIRGYCLSLLTDDEVRVRQLAGEVLGCLCRRDGPGIYASTKDIILDLLRTNLEQEPIIECTAKEHHDADRLIMERLSTSKFPTERRGSGNAAQILLETSSWKNLESTMKCLQAMIEGCGSQFIPFIDQDLLDLLFQALTHTNWFVRETSLYVCASLVECGNMDCEDPAEEMQSTTNILKDYSMEDEDSCIAEDNAIYVHGHQFCKYLGNGLSDNWSQVRLAASVATRKFLMSIPNNETRQKFFPELLPRMCLNRYYVAEGVRIYSQETWRQITGTEGKELVQAHIKHVVTYYIEQTQADSHAVREASCACIAELASKVNPDTVRPFVPSLLQALIDCFKDDSWPVRDAACLACGNFVLCFPEESRGAMESLYSLFFDNLGDNISSVRQGAASALGNVTRAYGQQSVDVMVTKIKEGLLGIEKQAAVCEKFTDNLSSTPVQTSRCFDIHSNSQVLPGGPLIPRRCSCSDHNFVKPSEPWELTDGCVYLVAELATIPTVSAQIPPLLPLVAKAASYTHYTHHVHFLETICKQLPVIARGVGKKYLKQHIDSFLDAIFYSLSCDNALTVSAASQCLNQLSACLGPSILRSRVELCNPKYLQQLDANVYIAAL